MNGLMMLHRLADGRGDGLLPSFSALLEEREAARHAAAGKLRELPGSDRQAGPNPHGRLPDRLPDNVVAFAPRKR